MITYTAVCLLTHVRDPLPTCIRPYCRHVAVDSPGFEAGAVCLSHKAFVIEDDLCCGQHPFRAAQRFRPGIPAAGTKQEV